LKYDSMGSLKSQVPHKKVAPNDINFVSV